MATQMLDTFFQRVVLAVTVFAALTWAVALPANAQEGALNFETVNVQEFLFNFPGNLTSFIDQQAVLDALPPGETIPITDADALEDIIIAALLAAGLDPALVPFVALGAPTQTSETETSVNLSEEPGTIFTGDVSDPTNIVVLVGSVTITTIIRETITTTIPISINQTSATPVAIPTLNPWMLVLLSVFLLGTGGFALQRNGLRFTP